MLIKVNFKLNIKMLLPTKEGPPQGGKPRHPGLNAPKQIFLTANSMEGKRQLLHTEHYSESPSVTSQGGQQCTADAALPSPIWVWGAVALGQRRVSQPAWILVTGSLLPLLAFRGARTHPE